MDQFIKWSNFSKIVPYAELFRQGLLVTVLLSLFTVMIGFCIALVLALMRMSNVRPFRALGFDKDGHQKEEGFLAAVSRFNPLAFLATAYVEILRSTPVVVQVFIIYYGVFGIIDLPAFKMFGFIKFDRFFPGVVALGLNSGAYVGEIVRAGIQAVDKGQTEAARSLGMTGWQTMRRVVLPQAFKNILPALGNEFVTVIKESSIVMTIGITELMFNTSQVYSSSFRYFESLIVCALVYFVMTFTTSRLLGVMERRMKRSA